MKAYGTMAAALLLVASHTVAQQGIRVSGEHTLGVRQLDLSTPSSKFNEYRDLRDGPYLSGLWLEVLDADQGRFMDLRGASLLRDDQDLRLRIGDYGSRWTVAVERRETPHRLANSAMTPYIHRGGGLFTLPGPVPILNDGDEATGTPSLVPTADQMAVNDNLIEGYLETHLRPATAGIERNRTAAALSVSPQPHMRFRLSFSDERRDGSRLGYGPIGDRPPRTTNLQLLEPVDYATRELRAEAEYARPGLQTQLRYSLSVFDNDVGALRWENFYFAPDGGADFAATVAGTPRHVADFGQRSLAPDNYSHNLALSGGLSLPRGGRLATTAAVGFLRQDESLLPYSASSLGGDQQAQYGDGLDWDDPDKLPRSQAEAEMRSVRLDLDYTVDPIDRLNLRVFARYYGLTNDTPTDEWRYVTQEAAGTDGGVNYRNYRRNLAHAFAKLNLGVGLRRYVSFWRTSVGLGYEREEATRDFREADTDENTLDASLRTRPLTWLSLRVGYLRGDRDGGAYDYDVTDQSYWYSFDQGATDVDNPQFLFGNHPDLRRYDVADRQRDALDLAATLAARHDLDLTATYRFRRDDYDSGVGPVAPLAGTTVPLPNPADADALTPGRQLGLLEDERRDLTVDAHAAPAERWTFSAVAGREEVNSTLRGMVFNENQRREPSNANIQAATALGPWTDPDRLYDARLEYRTNTVGLGATHEVLPGRLRLSTDGSLSRTTVDLEYSGYGADATVLGRDWETFQFGFDDPETIRLNHYELRASLEYELTGGLGLGLHYLFDRYRIRDWMQEPAGPWVEEVGSEFYLRDTSRDNRWGNRLVTTGSYSAPSYQAHLLSLTMRYRF